jgi:hypothetical protein
LLRPVSHFIIITLARRNKEAKIKGSKVNSMGSVPFKKLTTVGF